MKKLQSLYLLRRADISSLAFVIAQQLSTSLLILMLLISARGIRERQASYTGSLVAVIRHFNATSRSYTAISFTRTAGT